MPISDDDTGLQHMAIHTCGVATFTLANAKPVTTLSLAAAIRVSARPPACFHGKDGWHGSRWL